MTRYFLLPAALLLLSATASARRCELDGAYINLDHGGTYAGKSGMVKCYDDDGTLDSEQELRNGEFFGYERNRDLWGNVVERTTNENHNTHGVQREYYPDGTLKSEGTYDDGDLVGVSRSFHKNGKLQRVGFSTKDDNHFVASIEFDAEGRLSNLRCGDRSYLPEDREPCGFTGEHTSTLYHGRARARVTYAQGQLLKQESLDEKGQVAASGALEDGAEVRRKFHSNGAVAEELRIVEGWRVAEREWYMNGKLKRETTREPKERNARSETVAYRDDGTLSLREVLIDQRRVMITHYDEAGNVKEIQDYAEAGHLDRRRRFAADGSVTSDEHFYPDGSRR